MDAGPLAVFKAQRIGYHEAAATYPALTGGAAVTVRITPNKYGGAGCCLKEQRVTVSVRF